MQEKVSKAISVVLPYVQKYRYILIGFSVVLVFAAAVFRIDGTLQTERDEDAFNAQLTEVETVEFDTDAIENIRNLESSDAQINSSIQADRKNPFE